MSTILVTGGAGFIGSHVTEALVQRGHDVVVLDDLSGGFVDNVVPGTQFINGSITDVDLVQRLFADHQFDYVYHLAAYAAEGLSYFIKRFNYTNNLLGSVNLINAAVNTNVKCFVFTSSIAVYGSSAELPMREETPAHPEDPYGIAKLAVEQDLIVSQRLFGLNYVIFRPHNVYGERQNIADKYRNVIGIFMNQILQGKPMTIFGDGSQTRAFSYIRDMAPIMAEAITTPDAYNQIFNIGADQEYSLNELAHYISRAMGVEAQTNYLPARKEVLHAYSSHEKVRRVFNAHSLTSLETGLETMATWVKQHGARASKSFDNIEVMKNFSTSLDTAVTNAQRTATYDTAYHAVHLTEHAGRVVLWQVLTKYLSRYVPSQGAVLELGAGYCYWINSVRAARKVALDLWSELPRYAGRDVQALVHDLTNGLGVLGEQKFDAVMASNLLEHFEPDVTARLVGEIFTCLRPGGRLIVIQPNFRYAYRQYFDDYTHRSVFTHVSLANLMRANGFRIEAIEPKFMPYSLRDSRLKIRPWLIRAYLRSPIKPFAGQMLIVAQKP